MVLSSRRQPYLELSCRVANNRQTGTWAPKEWVESVYDGVKEVGLVQSKADPCVWKLVKKTSQGPQLHVLVLFHIDDFRLDAKVKLVGKSFSEECTTSGSGQSGNKDLRMTGVDVSQLQDGSFVIRRLTWTTLIQLKSNLNDGRRQRHL